MSIESDAKQHGLPRRSGSFYRPRRAAGAATERWCTVKTLSIGMSFAAALFAVSAGIAFAESPAGLVSPESPGVAAEPATSGELVLRSESFASGEAIPAEHTCDDADRSPALSWDGVPKGTRAFAIVMDDPDAPGGTFTHWLVWNLPGPTRGLARGVVTQADLGDCTKQGRNGFEKVGYGGPCPPKGETHTYRFRLFALEEPIQLDAEPDLDALVSAAEEKSLAEAELTGTYARGGGTPTPETP
jgi:Raf kinase inhibitor-like YbhB/YbcL family protein